MKERSTFVDAFRRFREGESKNIISKHAGFEIEKKSIFTSLDFIFKEFLSLDDDVFFSFSFSRLNALSDFLLFGEIVEWSCQMVN